MYKYFYIFGGFWKPLKIHKEHEMHISFVLRKIKFSRDYYYSHDYRERKLVNLKHRFLSYKIAVESKFINNM